MSSKSAVSMLAVLLIACGGRETDEVALRDSLGRDLSLVPADTTAKIGDVPEAESPTPPPASSKPASKPAAKPAPSPAPAPPPPPPAVAPTPPPAAAPARSLDIGTVMTLTAADSFSTQTHKVGQTITARVPADITNEQGRTVIPAGATITLAISQFEVSENKNDSGKVELRATNVTIDGKTYELDAISTTVDYQLKGRGVKAGDAAKVGAGAVVGGVVGRVLTGKKKGAVVGGVIGAAAGAASASQTYDRDVVVPVGAKIVIKLQQLLAIG